MDGWIDRYMQIGRQTQVNRFVMDELMDGGWIDGRMEDEQIGGWMDRWMEDGWMDGRMDKRMDEWKDGWMDGWTDEIDGQMGVLMGNRQEKPIGRQENK